MSPTQAAITRRLDSLDEAKEHLAARRLTSALRAGSRAYTARRRRDPKM